MRIRHSIGMVLLLAAFLAPIVYAANVKIVADDASKPLHAVLQSIAKENIGTAESIWIMYELPVRESMRMTHITAADNSHHTFTLSDLNLEDDGIKLKGNARKLVMMRFRKGSYQQPYAMRVIDTAQSLEFTEPAVRISNVSPERSLKLANALAGETGGLAREAVWYGLIALHDIEQAGDLLLEHYTTAVGVEKRKSVLYWYSKTLPSGSVGKLPRLQAQLNSNDEELLSHFAFLYGNLEGDEAFARLTGMIDDSLPDNVVESAVFWTGQSGRPEALTLLADLYYSINNDSVREKIIFSISQHDSPKATDHLFKIAKSSKGKRQFENAVFWLSEREDADVVPMLMELYNLDTSRRAREKIIFALSQHETETALRELIAIARNDPDKELRKNALFWLTQMSDESATEALEADLLDK